MGSRIKGLADIRSGSSWHWTSACGLLLADTWNKSATQPMVGGSLGTKCNRSRARLLRVHTLTHLRPTSQCPQVEKRVNKSQIGIARSTGRSWFRRIVVPVVADGIRNGGEAVGVSNRDIRPITSLRRALPCIAFTHPAFAFSDISLQRHRFDQHS